MDMMGYTYMYCKNDTCVHKECLCVFYALPVYEICTGSATLALMQTAYDSTEFNRLGFIAPFATLEFPF